MNDFLVWASEWSSFCCVIPEDDFRFVNPGGCEAE